MDNSSMQELFDTYANIPAPAIALMYDMEQVQAKYLDHIKEHGLTDLVFDEYEAIAEKYGVAYHNPKYEHGLNVVAGNATVH